MVGYADETGDSQLVEIRSDGSHIYRFSITADNLPPNAEIRLATHYQGAVFSNGSRYLTLTRADFSTTGVANILIELPNGADHRTCHTMETFLNN